MTAAMIERLRRAAAEPIEGSSLDSAWRALMRRGFARPIGRGKGSYTAALRLARAAAPAGGA